VQGRVTAQCSLHAELVSHTTRSLANQARLFSPEYFRVMSVKGILRVIIVKFSISGKISACPYAVESRYHVQFTRSIIDSD
jgi:hypothetical protein